jgi:haloacetate dehalogenase
MARDMVAVMNRLGHERFAIVGHDRGARVAYRMALDTPDVVERIAVLDILPTAVYWDKLDRRFGLALYHWMFLAQPAPLPETLIGGSAGFFCDHTLAAWTRTRDLSGFDPRALEHYRAQCHDPARIATMCADYRAGAGPDVDADNADRAARMKIALPLLALWGAAGLAASAGTPLEVWKAWAHDARGAGIDSGHFIPEENPEGTLAALLPFLAGG